VVKLCGGQTFANTSFCMVSYDNNPVQGTNAYGRFNATNTNSTAAPSIKTLCGTQYDKIIYDDVNFPDKEIPANFTKGEYYEVIFSNGTTLNAASPEKNGIPGNVAAGLSSYKTWTRGNTSCKNNKVMTLCNKGTSTASEVWYDATTEFCVEKSTVAATLNDTVLVKNLCVKTGSTTGGGTYDDVDYFCDNATGEGRRKCGGAFYGKAQFCWGGPEVGDIGDICNGPSTKATTIGGTAPNLTYSCPFVYSASSNSPVSLSPTNTGNGGAATAYNDDCKNGSSNQYNKANYDPKLNACGYLPDVQQGASLAVSIYGNAGIYATSLLSETPNLSSITTPLTRQVALPICGGKIINKDGWKWEFCNNGTNVSYCGANQVPNPDDPTQCKTCGLLASEKNPGVVIVTNAGVGYCECAGSNILAANYKCVPPSCPAGQNVQLDGTCNTGCPTNAVASAGVCTCAGSVTGNTCTVPTCGTSSNLQYCTTNGDGAATDCSTQSGGLWSAGSTPKCAATCTGTTPLEPVSGNVCLSVCPANQFVLTSACHACPTSGTYTSGDIFTAGATECAKCGTWSTDTAGDGSNVAGCIVP